jgi:hypothetical protein
MRRSGCIALVLQCYASASVGAQATGVVVAAENSSRVDARFGLVIPSLTHAHRPAAPRVIAKREEFTEYIVVCAVSANTSWELIATSIPDGVSIRNERGEWMTAAGDGSALSRGRPERYVEVLLLVRVRPGVEPGWDELVALRVKPVETRGVPRTVVE